MTSGTRSSATCAQPPAAERSVLERDGYVVVEGALGDNEVARLLSALERTWARHRSSPPAAGAEALHLLGFVGEEDAFVELVDHPSVLPIVVDALGWNVFVYHCHLDVHPPAGPSNARRWMWHRDGGVQNRDLEGGPAPRMSLKVAYFLSDVSEPGRGNFVVVPGSHVRDEPIERGAADHVLEGAVPILARPGDAVVFDRRLWHMRSENRSTVTRKALFYAYTYRWVRPRDDLPIPAARAAVMTPVRAQLLGFGTGAISYWMPDADDAPLRAAVERGRS
jgi:ectoine hydroxylase-related dioxygenase (phytanoyl-CoA dioxygenase family)